MPFAFFVVSINPNKIGAMNFLPSVRSPGHRTLFGCLLLVCAAVVTPGAAQVGDGEGFWQPRSSVNAPVPRRAHTAVWTGSEMIVWGGENGAPLGNGGRYEPHANIWTSPASTGAPAARYDHTAIWTGSEMIVWGGRTTATSYLNSGARYNPTADTWTPVSQAGAPSERALHAAVWTGTNMLVWGGRNSERLGNGASYDPVTDTWKPLSTENDPIPRSSFTAVWTGREMIVWGGLSVTGSFLTSGGRYEPGGDTWTETALSGAPRGRYDHSAVWTGNQMVIWGGNSGGSINTGGNYNPNVNTWLDVNTTDSATARQLHTAVWDGGEMIVWGGYRFDSTDGSTTHLSDGGLYFPGINFWFEPRPLQAPPRSGHTSVWIGGEMLMFGGGNAETMLGDLWTFVQLQPTISVERDEGGLATIHWEPPLPGVVVEGSAALEPADWEAIEADTREPVIVSTGGTIRFYRVTRP